jgi:hypothetical protein
VTPLLGKTPSALTHQIRDFSAHISGTQRFTLLTAGSLAVTIALGVVFIQIPWQEAREQLASEQQENAEQSALLLSLRGHLNKLKNKEKASLLEGGTPILTSEVIRIASESGLEIESVTPRDGASFGPYTKFQIQVTGFASSERLIKFLRLLEQHRPILLLDELETGSPKTFESTPSGFHSSAGYGRSVSESFQPRPEQKIRLVISAVSWAKLKP